MCFLIIIMQDQFHNKMADRKDVVISMPQINTVRYKNNVREIQESVNAMNAFTDNLEDKVALMLKGQETQFVNSYKNHMKNVQDALKEYQQRINDYQKKIQYYQNEGVLSTLLNKIAALQGQQKKLLDRCQKKDKIIFDLKIQIGTLNKEIQSLHDRIKELLKTTAPIKRVKEVGNRQQKESQRTFATEVPHSILKSNQSLERIVSEDMNYKTILNSEDKADWQAELNRAKNQVLNLKKRNRQLSSVNSRIIDKVGEVDQFFLKIINELKRKISARKHFTACSFEDFKQQDKLQLLVKVLSNQDILQHLYERIFHKQQNLDLKSDHFTKGVTRLPSISTARK